MNDGDEQIYDLSPLSPSADIDEIRDHLMRLHAWRRAREPVSEGGILAKYVTNGALVNRGLLSFSPGVSGAGADGWTPSATGGEDGLAGINATLLALTATGFAFVFSDPAAVTTTSPDIIFTANLTNVSGTVTFSGTAYDAANAVVGVAGDVTFTSVTATGAALTGANFHRGGSTVRYVKVTATLGALTDTMTIYRGDNGSDGVQARLTNEAHTIAAEEDGTVIAYTGASGTMQAYKGVNLLSNVTTPSVSFSIVGFTGFTSAYSAPGTSFFSGALTINATTGAYQVSGNVADASTAATVTFRATLSTGETRDSIFSISKSLTGSAGKSIKAVSSAGNAFVGASSGTGFTPSTLTLTRTLLGGLTSSGTTVWTITRGSFADSLTVINTTTGSFGSFDAGDLGADVVTFRCTHTEGGNSYTDDITIFRTKDAMSAYLTNDSISLPADNAGVISSYTGATGTLKVVNATGDVGTSVLTFSIAGHSGFNTVFPVNTGISITSGGVYTVSSNVANASDVAWVDFQAVYADPLGGTKTFTRRFTIGKSKAGADGADGADGSNGTRGSLKGYGYGQYGIVSSSWSNNKANRVINNMITGQVLTTDLATTGHLVIGDTVVLGNGSTFTEERFWSGSAWLMPGTVINGNLLVGGTISGTINLNIGGSARFDGIYTMPISVMGSSLNRTAVIVANSANPTNADVGVIGYTSGSTRAGVVGINVATSGTDVIGVYGEGRFGVVGWANSAGGYGMRAVGNPSGASASHGLEAFANNTASGSRAIYAYANSPGQTAIRAESTSGVALEVAGVLRINQTPTTGAATATFLANKPGSNSNVAWISFSANGTTYYIPVWT